MVGAAARGAGLVALAVAIGLVLMWVGDDDGARLAANRKPAKTEPARTSTSSSAPTSSTTTSSTSTTTTTTAAGINAGDVRVLVLNGTEKPNQARPLTNKLRDAGYQTLTPSDAPRRATSVVLCKPAFEAAEQALLAATGLDGTVGELSEDSDMPGAPDADCIVVIGAPG